MDKPHFPSNLIKAIDLPERGLVQLIEDEALRYCVVRRMVSLRVLEVIGDAPKIDFQSQKGRLHSAILKAVEDGETDFLRTFLEIQCAEFRKAFSWIGRAEPHGTEGAPVWLS